MFNGNWGKRNKYWPVVAGVALVASVIACTLLYAIYATSQNWQQANQNAQEIQSKTNRNITERCSRLYFADAQKCVSDAAQAAKNEERDEADLYAQRQMAVWAAVMSIAALVSIPLSLTGIFFVWRSLEEMEAQRGISKTALRTSARSNEIQQRIADSNIGPKLKILTCTIDVTERAIFFHMKVKNIGKTHAFAVNLQGRVRLYHDQDDITGGISSIDGEGIMGEIDIEPNETTYVSEYIRTSQIEKLAGDCFASPHLASYYCRLVWNSQFENQHNIEVRLEPRKFRTIRRLPEAPKKALVDMVIRSTGVTHIEKSQNEARKD